MELDLPLLSVNRFNNYISLPRFELLSNLYPLPNETFSIVDLPVHYALDVPIVPVQVHFHSDTVLFFVEVLLNLDKFLVGSIPVFLLQLHSLAWLCELGVS